ncbi:nitroreductase family protein [Chitinibacter sp. ZOR0017]|uniref:nitroreductase family protein n=1 Tax=Chitinibacter sp. ZOR0017 TaxID=1339254 RepID=UPI00064661E0|nr:nitroreductase family protein [Chitinibacter sp. ZOR0017]
MLPTLLQERISCNYFDPDFVLSPAQLQTLIALATQAPSAYNAQNWRFIAVQSAAAKARLLPLAYGQQKVADAAVTFIICGQMGFHTELANTLQPAVAAGILSSELQQMMVHYATEGYQTQPQLQRDEAIRSASLAAMALMLAAQHHGWASCPMIGFDAAGVSAEFGLAEHEVPVMLLPVGRAGAGNWPRKPRKPVAEVLLVV